MVFKEMFERFRGNELTAKERKAFADLANKLIFTEKVNIPLTKANVDRLANKVLEDFLHLEYEFNRKSNLEFQKTSDEIKRLGESLLKKAKGESVEPEDKIDEPDNKKDTESAPSYEQYLETFKVHGEITIEKINELVYKILGVFLNAGIIGYDGWGFTPKLSIRKQDPNKDASVFNFHINRNCLGITTTIAAYLRMNKIDFDFGMSANHPYLVIEMEGETYLISNFGMKRFSGMIDDTENNCKVMTPVFSTEVPAQSEGEKAIETIGEFNFSDSMIYVCDYNQGLIYELLENFEVLRQLALGQDVTGMPETYKSGIEIAKENEQILKTVDWKSLQEKVFQEIYNFFLESDSDWRKDIEKSNGDYLKVAMENRLFKILKGAQAETTYRGLKFEEGQGRLKLEIRSYIPEVVAYLFSNSTVPDVISEDAKKYLAYIKAEIDKIKQVNNEENPKEWVMIRSIFAEKLARLNRSTELES